MSNIARHHTEWMSLLEINGPFLSMPVLLRMFPQGIEEVEPELAAELRQAYNEWLDNQHGTRPDPAIHRIWISYVLQNILGFTTEQILQGDDIPSRLSARILEHGETLKPDFAIPMLANEDESTDTESPDRQGIHLLVSYYPVEQKIEGTLKGKNWKASPATRMTELLRSCGVQMGLVTNGEQWMLVNAPKGETSSFISWYGAIWNEERLTLRALISLLGARRFFNFPEEEQLAGMLKTSLEEQHEVTEQLGYQVRRAVEMMVRALDTADRDRGRELLQAVPEADVYESALTVMMRLVFLFSAEERGLLLLGDPIYDEHYAVSTLRDKLRESADRMGEGVLERRYDAWGRLLATFRAVYFGIQHDRLRMPAYGGSLFDPAKYPFLEGRTLEGSFDPLSIDNRTVLHLLEALQILRVKVPGGSAEPRRLSFRGLDVEQIGHVYEGLLDHTVIKAEDVVLGFQGGKGLEPEIPLAVLIAKQKTGQANLIKYMAEETGRTEKAIIKDLENQSELLDLQRLRSACGNDETIFAKVEPFANLIRQNDLGLPTVYLSGSYYMTAGQTRRSTGTHYTPRSLTEPIVRHTMEPIVYVGPAEGYPKEDWILKPANELLELKICDMAMGSAGFLVQVVRYLSERLVESWDHAARKIEPGSVGSRITPTGKPAVGAPNEVLIPKDDEEKLVLARRLVADRCIYGVDKNPLAVEIAKLSIWLTTMDKGRPFTFLDHALKCGDALVGADEKMFHDWSFSQGGAQFVLYAESLDELVAQARDKRKRLETLNAVDMRDVEAKAQLLREAEKATARLKLGADLLVGAKLLGLNAAEEEAMLGRFLWDYTAGIEMDGYDTKRALNAASKERVFHWHFEFPEVFQNDGFDAIVGNPPFIGGKKISTVLGSDYKEYIFTLIGNGIKGSADISAYFLLRAFLLLNLHGKFGLIATNTISQAGTREVGLIQISKKGGVIYRAENNLKWPGTAGVVINIIHLSRNIFHPPLFLDSKNVDYISSALNSSPLITKPKALMRNKEQCFVGTIVNGEGFILSNNEANQLLYKNSQNKKILFRYLTGEDLNTRIDQTPSRWIINFFDWPIEKAREYADCFSIVTEKVKPHRDLIISKGKQIHEYAYWKFWDKRAESYNLITEMDRVLVCPLVTKFLSFVFTPPIYIFSHKVAVFTFDDYAHFSILQSTFHEIWSRYFSSTLAASVLNYSPSNCYYNFTFPKSLIGLNSFGEAFYAFRKEIMDARQEGLTATYNHFHDPKENSQDFVQLRALQVEMDNAVLAKYGWNDLDLGHGFHDAHWGHRYTIHPEVQTELLSRLFELNQQYHEEEVSQSPLGAEKPKRSKTTTRRTSKPKTITAPSAQMGMFTTPEPEPPVAPRPQQTSASPASEIERWKSYRCLGCGKTVPGFDIAGHTAADHKGKDPGYKLIPSKK